MSHHQIHLPTPHIHLDRLSQDVLELAQIGRHEASNGIYRMAYTQADLEGRQWLQQRMRAAGLETWMDGAANVFGRLPGRNPELPVLLIGSHTDTVPAGGPLDGALGVLVGLEVLRVMKEQGLEPERSIEVVSFSDEEGRFGGMLGSQAFTGDLRLQDVFEKTDPEGVSLQDHMQAVGLDPMGLLGACRDAKEIFAYLELHIEQGPILETLKKPIGIVDGIIGLFKAAIQIKGRANHAGTTPMQMRRDAFQGLSAFADEIPRILAEDGTEVSRATIGKVELKPNFPHTIPGEAEFTLVVRDPSTEVMNHLESAFRKVLAATTRRRDLEFTYERISWIDPSVSDQALVNALELQANKLGYAYEIMSSGAGHDAQFMARVAPTAMVFVPSIGSVSHSPAEWTDLQDIEKGANLMLHTALELTREVGESLDRMTAP
jgi:beta-ureidopropionase / N-carbamoyl-L-amino-acid hydrolase